MNGVDSLGASPLLYAALRGHVEIITTLVNKGANLDFQDSANGWTALMQVPHRILILGLEFLNTIWLSLLGCVLWPP